MRNPFKLALDDPHLGEHPSVDADLRKYLELCAGEVQFRYAGSNPWYTITASLSDPAYTHQRAMLERAYNLAEDWSEDNEPV